MYGVVAAVPTPVTGAGDPVRDLFLSHCQWALENGCDGLNILGSTGEANSFSTAARKSVMAWAAEHIDRTRLMVGTGTPSLAETIELTAFADQCGYKVALVLPPYYYKPVSDEGLIAWYSHLHEALGASKIAIYFYNFPQMTGISIPVAVIEELHRRWPERFAGIKDSSGELPYCRELTALLPDLNVFPSSEVALGEAVAKRLCRLHFRDRQSNRRRNAPSCGPAATSPMPGWLQGSQRSARPFRRNRSFLRSSSWFRNAQTTPNGGGCCRRFANCPKCNKLSCHRRLRTWWQCDNVHRISKQRVKMTKHDNLIGAEWVSYGNYQDNINPSDTSDVIGSIFIQRSGRCRRRSGRRQIGFSGLARCLAAGTP